MFPSHASGFYLGSRTKFFFMRKIKLSGKKGAGKFALVDDEDYVRLSASKWSLGCGGYAESSIKKDGKYVHIRMHTLVMKTTRMIDHKNRKPLDNRKQNLRICSTAQNSYNRRQVTGKTYKGVHQTRGKWKALIEVAGKRYNVCGFDTPRDAAIMYNYLAKHFFGEFAYLNKIRRS